MAAAPATPIEPIETTLREFHAWLRADDAKGWAHVGRCFGQIAAEVARILAADERYARAHGVAGLASTRVRIIRSQDAYLLLMKFLTETQRLTDMQLTTALYCAIDSIHKTRLALISTLVSGGARADTRTDDHPKTSKNAFHWYLMRLARDVRRFQLSPLCHEVAVMSALLESGGSFAENDEKWDEFYFHNYGHYDGEWPRLLIFIHYGGYGLIYAFALLECSFNAAADLNATTPDGRNAAHIICATTWWSTNIQIQNPEEWAKKVRRALQAFARRGDLRLRDDNGETPGDVLASRRLADGPEMAKLRALLA